MAYKKSDKILFADNSKESGPDEITGLRCVKIETVKFEENIPTHTQNTIRNSYVFANRVYILFEVKLGVHISSI